MNFKEIIKAHLDKMAGQDAAFAERYKLENKSLDKCIDYIFSEARKQAVGNSAAIEDSVVFGWAVHYYQEDNIKTEKVQASVKHSENNGKKKEDKSENVKPIKAIVKDKKDSDKCQQLDLFAGF